MRLRYSLADRACVAACLCCLVLGCDSDVDPEDQPTESVEVADEQSSAHQVAAVVNDREITAAQVDHHLDRLGQLYHHSDRSFDRATRKAKRTNVLQRLIDRELLRDYASSRDVQLDNGEVDRQLRERVDRAFGSTDDFRRYLDDQDKTVSDYRDRIREELTLEQLVERRIDSEEIDQDRLRRYYDRIANRRPADDRLKATRLRIELREVEDEQYRRLQQRLRASVATLETAEELETLGGDLEQWIEDERLIGRVQLRDRRWYEQNQLDPRAAGQLFEDSTDEPDDRPRLVDTAMGFDVYLVHDHREAGIREFDEVEQLVRDRARRSRLQKQRRALIEELREEADIAIYDRQYRAPESP